MRWGVFIFLEEGLLPKSLGSGVAVLGLWLLVFHAVPATLDLFGKPSQEIGRVNRVWSDTVTPPMSFSSTYRYIDVVSHKFKVSQAIHNWLSEGDEVVVSYWPRSELVKRVDKVTKEKHDEGQPES